METSELVRCIYLGDICAARALIQDGHNVNALDEDGKTPLMDAILASNWSAAMVQLLLDSGASVQIADNEQCWTPLHLASRDGKPELVELLLQRGARIDAVDVYGNTPLWRAITAHQNAVEVVTLLIDAGASPHVANNAGVSPFEFAKQLQRSDLIAMLEKVSRA